MNGKKKGGKKRKRRKEKEKEEREGKDYYTKLQVTQSSPTVL
jgi:hypothetical protein